MHRTSIPLAQPLFDTRELEAVQNVLQSGWVVQGPEVEAFEAAIAQRHQARNCIVVSSGTAALHISFLALGIGPGDAVFVPGFAWPSAANMAIMVGARPVFVDVLPKTYNMDPADLSKRIAQCLEHQWGKPLAVVPVHTFGLAADMEALQTIARTFDLEVIEDAACALGAAYHGRPVGSLGKIGIFSFHPRKALTTGEGGAIVTNDDLLADRCRQLRNHGQTRVGDTLDFCSVGLNYRMTDIQAAIGKVQMRKLPAILDRRRQIAETYSRELQRVGNMMLPAMSPQHTWQTYMIVLSSALSRHRIIGALTELGIQTGPGAVAGTQCSIFQQYIPDPLSDYPVSADLHHQGLALPLYSQMQPEEVLQVVEALHRVLEQRPCPSIESDRDEGIWQRDAS